MIPARGKLIVRKADTEETMPNGRIVLTQNAREHMAANQVQVVDVGEPEQCTKERCRRPHNSDGGIKTHPHSLEPDAWLLVKPRCLTDACHDTDRLYIIGQNDALAVFRVERDGHAGGLADNGGRAHES